jgi:hypothetical protein
LEILIFFVSTFFLPFLQIRSYKARGTSKGSTNMMILLIFMSC